MAVSPHSIAKPTGITSTWDRVNTTPAGSGIYGLLQCSHSLQGGKAAGRRSATYATIILGLKQIKTIAFSPITTVWALYQALVIHLVTPHVSAQKKRKDIG